MVVAGVKIGVLGGIGPESTCVFYSKLIQELQKHKLVKSNIDFPTIIINSIPAPELIHDKHLKEEINIYLQGLKELEKHKPKFIVMICNTIHFYFDYLLSEINTPIIDLREELKKIVKSLHRYVVFGTPLTIKKMYNFNEKNQMIPNNKDIKIIKECIFNYNKGYKKSKQKKIIHDLCEKYHKKGAEKIILGCTELTLMVKKPYTIDTIDVLVKAVVEKCQS